MPSVEQIARTVKREVGSFATTSRQLLDATATGQAKTSSYNPATFSTPGTHLKNMSVITVKAEAVAPRVGVLAQRATQPYFQPLQQGAEDISSQMPTPTEVPTAA